jgi:hypothetical protein
MCVSKALDGIPSAPAGHQTVRSWAGALDGTLGEACLGVPIPPPQHGGRCPRQFISERLGRATIAVTMDVLHVLPGLDREERAPS